MPHQYSLESEQESQSNFSPKLVSEQEVLLRLLYAPEHIVDGNVIETAISLKDLKCRGVSLDRLSYVEKEIIKKRIAAQTSKAPDKRQEASLSKFSCSDIRSIKNNNNNDQVFLIIDDATQTNIAHASIFLIKESCDPRKARAELVSCLQDRASLSSLIP